MIKECGDCMFVNVGNQIIVFTCIDKFLTDHLTCLETEYWIPNLKNVQFVGGIYITSSHICSKKQTYLVSGRDFKIDLYTRKA